MFCDATPDGDLKVIASIIFMSAVSFLLFINIIMVTIMLCKGKKVLREDIK